MSKTLIIAEKPSAAKVIAAALGGFSKVETWLERDDLIIAPAIGHLVQVYVAAAATVPRGLAGLPQIPDSFDLGVIEATKSQFALIKRLMKRSDVTSVVNACDAGREGELIFRLIYEHAGCKKPMQRMWYQSMTDESLNEAFSSRMPGSAYDDLSDAARCRVESDWLVGINGSRAITSLIERMAPSVGPCNAGRVLTPTTAFIVDLEYQILRFVSQDYWEVHADLAIASGSYTGKWVGNTGDANSPAQEGEADEDSVNGSKFWDHVQALEIVEKCRGVAPSDVQDVIEVSKSSPPRLFDSTSLQREANRRFKFSAKKTGDIAQALYEVHKVTTYPRTESTALPEDFVGKVKEVLSVFNTAPYGGHAARILNNDWVQGSNKNIFNDKKITDHWAIIPEPKIPSGLSPDETKIYNLIVCRFLAVFHPAATYNKTTRTTIISGETFISRGKSLVERGWLEVYDLPKPSDATNGLGALQPGETAQNLNVACKALKTAPPKRYTEDTLLGAMESAGKFVADEEQREALKARGLGTGATRPSTIEAILSDKDGQGRPKEPYARLDGPEQYLVPTKKAMSLIPFCRDIGIGDLTLPDMTGEWEMRLRLMERGEYPRSRFMEEVALWVVAMVAALKAKAETLPAVVQRELPCPCPGCGAPVLSLTRTFECKSSCGFKLWREFFQRNFSDAEAAHLITHRSIKQLDGLVSKAKKKFSAGVKLTDDFKTELVFEDRDAGASGGAPLATLPVPCPKCGGAVLIKTGQYAQYVCEKGDFQIYKTVATRVLSDAEVSRLIKDGQLPVMAGFKSAKNKNKPFTAGLRLMADKSKAEFFFNEPR
ncbi:DNA topoisomerase [Pseudomonas amygdali]|uniref:DNA topoisomerase n=1 Tax=Pseudomonas amygdali TaxID=47877 RepID=UPI0006E72686|nr:DNA topoisomerase [Pseudomonas amygdali]KPY55702.1 hypothetical protein ALO93_200265 [Pseudomonas amygdali pv. sesami]